MPGPMIPMKGPVKGPVKPGKSVKPAAKGPKPDPYFDALFNKSQASMKAAAAAPPPYQGRAKASSGKPVTTKHKYNSGYEKAEGIMAGDKPKKGKKK
jgi:hypothetical protein